MTDETEYHDGRVAARQLLEYLEREQKRRCREILERADTEADELRREARRHALALVHEAVKRERARRTDQLRAEHARIDARFRRERFKREQEGLERARSRLVEALVERWESGAAARREWLRVTCEQALGFLPEGQWRVMHPRGWDQQEARRSIAVLERLRPAVEVEFTAGDQEAGLLVTCGSASVDSRPAGLLADRRRVDGLLLRALEELEPGEGRVGDNGSDS